MIRAVLNPALFTASLLAFAASALAQGTADDAAEDTASSTEAPSREDMPLPATSDAMGDDVSPPIIEDVAVAASSPHTAPMVTAVINDDWSGVDRAHVYYRPPGASGFQSVALMPGTGGLFVARLPEGTQHSGFEYYLEVWDAANNGPARMGSPEQPYRVEPAGEGTVARLEREQAVREMGPVHPAWMMLSLGGGVLAAAGAGVFWLDFAHSQSRLAEETNPKVRMALENAVLSDVVIGSVLGVMAVAGLATGAGLLIYAALEE